MNDLFLLIVRPLSQAGESDRWVGPLSRPAESGRWVGPLSHTHDIKRRNKWLEYMIQTTPPWLRIWSVESEIGLTQHDCWVSGCDISDFC